MYFKKIITFMLVTVVATTSFILPAQAASKTKAPLDIQANAAFMIEASTGKVLYNKNEIIKKITAAYFTSRRTIIFILSKIYYIERGY